jgi:hypothetical protein
MAKAQAEMKPAEKTGDNKYHQSMYSTHKDIVDSVREPMGKNGLSAFQGIVHRQVGETMQAFMLTRICHSSGQWIEDEGAPLMLTPDKKGNVTMQAFGSAHSYARRYGLQAAMNVASSEDDDGEKAQREWAGPLGLSELKAEGRRVHTAIVQASDIDTLNGLQVDEVEVIQQLMHDLPQWWNGTANSAGLKKVIAETHEKLLQEQA